MSWALIELELRTLLQIQPAHPGPSLPPTLMRTQGTTPTFSPFGQQHDGVAGAMDQAHDGVAIVMPVDDQCAPTNAAHKPADGHSRQTWRVLGKGDSGSGGSIDHGPCSLEE